MLLQKSSILGISLEGSVEQVSDEWDDSNQTVNDNVHEHAISHGGGKGCIDLATLLPQLKGHGSVDQVSDFRNDSNHTAPAKADAGKVEERHVQVVSATLDLSKNLGVVLGNVVRNLLLDFPLLAVGQVDVLKERVLCSISTLESELTQQDDPHHRRKVPCAYACSSHRLGISWQRT